MESTSADGRGDRPPADGAGARRDGRSDARLVRASGISKSFGSGAARVRAVRDVVLEIHRGDLITIEGPSGSGKSTLLHLLGGLEEADSGTVEIAGHQLGHINDRERARIRRRHVGLLFQRGHLLPRLRAWENVALPTLLDGRTPARARAGAMFLLDAVGLAHRGDHLPGQLSGGEYQRVALARALANQPDLVLADEPTGSLDSEAGGQVLDLLRSLVGAVAGGMVIVTHDPTVAAAGTRRMAMADGRLQARAATDQEATRPASAGYRW